MASFNVSLLPRSAPSEKIDQRLAPGFRLHQIVRSEINGIVELRTAAGRLRLSGSAVVSSSFGTLPIVVLLGRWSHRVNLLVQLFAGVGEVLKQLHFAIEMDEECLASRNGIRCLGRRRGSRCAGRAAGRGTGRQHQVDELFRCFTFGIHGRHHAAARINQQSDAEREIGLVGEALDHLRPAIFGESEVAGREVLYQGAFLVNYRYRQQDFARLHLDGGHGLRGGRLLGSARAAGAGKGERSENEIE